MPLRPQPRVALVHPHLRPGGVTSVILAQAAALRAAAIPHVLLSGSPAAETPSPHHPIRGMDYQQHTLAQDRELSSQLLAAANHALGPGPVVWHFHNPFLGRSTPFARSALRFARAGLPCLFHLHDFAEDGRPHCMDALRSFDRLYPFADHLITAVINSRDQQLLLEAGHPPSSLALIDHPLTLSPSGSKRENPRPSSPTPSSHPPTLLYPVRGLRRKNIGECLLWTLITSAKWTLAISRAPNAATDLASFSHWQAWATRHRLPIVFAATDHIPPPGSSDTSFSSWQTHSTHTISTSIAEGFGLSFLEAAITGKPFIARRIRSLQTDLTRWQLDSPFFYDAITLPSSWLPLRRSHPRLDFASLDLQEQTTVLDHLARHPHAAAEILVHTHLQTFQATSWIAQALTSPAPTPPDLSRFLPENHLAQLLPLYQKILTASPSPVGWLERSRLANLFATRFPTPPLLR